MNTIAIVEIRHRIYEEKENGECNPKPLDEKKEMVYLKDLGELDNAKAIINNKISELKRVKK